MCSHLGTEAKQTILDDLRPSSFEGGREIARGGRKHLAKWLKSYSRSLFFLLLASIEFVKLLYT